ncbi:MAG: hypothetical protein C5B51_01700 [Terriglobia bacterium]|nr:MAG: hypothetical protein C5B51_01700 [Terriglobia bacterium]
MASGFSKFTRPEQPKASQLSERDLDILEVVLRYRFLGAAQTCRLVGGNEDVTHRRLRLLWEHGLINRWAFPGIRTHSEFYYYLDKRQALAVLADRRGLVLHPQMIEELRNNREKDYASAAVRGQHMQLGFLRHSLMVSRLHFMLELACRKSSGQVQLIAFEQGSSLSGRKVEAPKLVSSREGGQIFWQEGDEQERLPLEPDALFTLKFSGRPEGQDTAHFFYEADRGSMAAAAMLKKFRAYYHFIKRQQKHKEAFGIHPVRAVLVETTNEASGQRLMRLVNHPLVAGPSKRAGLFWFTISTLFTEGASGTLPYLEQPEMLFEPIWALPDRSLHRLTDAENA